MIAWKVFRKSQKNFTDQDILEGLMGDKLERQMFENYLFDRYSPLIMKAKKQHKITDDEALSAYSDAILSLIDQIRKNKFRADSKISTYLYKIYQFKCIDLIRKKSRNPDIIHWLDDFPNLGSQVKDVLQQLISREKVEQLRIILNDLGKGCKELLLMWGEGYSLEEIAKNLNFKDAGSVKSRKYKCLQLLKNSFHIESIQH